MELDIPRKQKKKKNSQLNNLQSYYIRRTEKT